MVIANLLTTYKKTVTAVGRSGEVIKIDKGDGTTEIESLIVNFLVDQHSQYIRAPVENN